ncbi:MAG: histidine phosphatase family protein [Clostridia bacterium]|nr:histidine phosphatase family protein [Clostridia bacterium]
MLYIMRHGQTEWNVLHKMQGRTDVPLNDTGRQMALKAGEEYKSVHFDVCYCSPLNRALETARLVLKGRDIPIIIDDRLIEMGFGIYEGLANSFQIPDCPINVVFQEPEKYTQSLGGSETFDELFKRTGEFINEIVEPQLAAGKDILIVGHATVNSGIVCQIKNMPIEEFWNSNHEQCRLLSL